MGRKAMISAAVAGMMLAAAVNQQPNRPRLMRPGEYSADQVAVLDAFGTSAQTVRIVRHAGRTPICWMARESEKALELCADKGFNVYAVGAGSAGS